MPLRVFLDHAATTPMLPSVEKLCRKWLDCGNPSALYAEGRAAKAAIDEAREAITTRIGVAFPEVIFAGSGTESANLAIIGAALGSLPSLRPRIVLSAAEHHCVLNTAPFLTRLGYQVELAPVDSLARIDPDWLEEALRTRDVLLVSAMHANNELGTFNDVSAIARMCSESGTLFYCDAVQTFGKIPFTAEQLGADLISFSAHKLGGPKGIGALYIKPGTPVKPLVSGGGQERELRGGTENVAAIAGFGEACRQILFKDETSLAQEFALSLEKLGAVATVPSGILKLNGHIHVRFPGVVAETFLIALDRLGVSAGSGAACSSGSIEPSHVLLACGWPADQAQEGIRFTLGRETTADDLRFALDQISATLERIAPTLTTGT